MRGVIRLGELLPVVRLACTACELVYQPELADFGSGNTGCPRCGGWTWIAQLDTTSAGDGGGGVG
ncbi:MAG: hypothetical protein DLM61_18125 [Pseudonocardiales bacterium]|nr:MAG: hypothetical protein DLM61_18125 [Pseudonocardiales bacterium]